MLNRDGIAGRIDPIKFILLDFIQLDDERVGFICFYRIHNEDGVGS